MKFLAKYICSYETIIEADTEDEAVEIAWEEGMSCVLPNITLEMTEIEEGEE